MKFSKIVLTFCSEHVQTFADLDRGLRLDVHHDETYVRELGGGDSVEGETPEFYPDVHTPGVYQTKDLLWLSFGLNEVIAKIQEALQDAEKDERPTSYASWNSQEGVLLTLDEAKALIEAISTK